MQPETLFSGNASEDPISCDHCKRRHAYDLHRCVICGDAAGDTSCDDCRRWLCWEHAIVEAQAWDVHGFDGVDIRCPDHRHISFAVRGLLRGQYVPPPCPQSGAEREV